MKRRNWSVLFGLLLVVSMVLAACGGEDATATSPPEPTEPPTVEEKPTEPPEPTKAPEPTEAPPMPGADKQGGSAIMGFYQEPELLNPEIGTQTVAGIVWDLFYRGLIVASPEGEPLPDLVKEVPTVANGGVSEDGMTITYHMKEDIVWEDGDPVDCQDVVFSFEAIMHPESGAVSTTGFEDMKSVTCEDDYTVVVEYETFYAPYLWMFGTLLPSHLDLDPADMQNWDLNRLPLSNGPFKFEEWVSGDHLTVVRNENYEKWETEGKPYLDAIVFRWIESREVGKQLIQTGELDFVWDLIEADLPEAETWEGVEISAPASTGTERLLLNLADPELDAPCADYLRENPSPHWALGDPKVREAIELGIDKRVITEKLLYGYAPVGTTELNLGWGAPEIAESEFNTEKAIALLEEAGWTDEDGDGVRECNGCPYAEAGKPLKLKIQTTSGNALREQAEQVIMEMLAEVGIELFIENVPSSELFGSYSSGAFRKHGQFDILMYTTSYGSDPHSQMFGYYSTERIPCDDNAGTGYNYARWIDDEYDAQMEIAGSNPDLEVRKAAYQKASERIAEGRPHIYLYDRGDIDLLREDFMGYEMNIWESVTYSADEWWLDR